MALTKKHFEKIAEIIKARRTGNKKIIEMSKEYTNPYIHNARNGRYSEDLIIAKTLADYFKTQNNTFDRKRFLKACEVEE